MAVGLVKLTMSVGRLPVDQGVMGSDEVAEVAVEGPGVVDGSHACVGDAG